MNLFVLQIPLPDAMYNFYKTQPWDEARDVIHDILPCLRMYNMESCQYQILSRLAELSDPERDAWAFEVCCFSLYCCWFGHSSFGVLCVSSFKTDEQTVSKQLS